MKDDRERRARNHALILEKVKKYVAMNRTYAFIFYALEKDQQVKQIRHWRRTFYGIIQELEREVVVTNKHLILRGIFHEETKEEIQEGFFLKHRTIRSNKENKELFDELYEDLFSVYGYFMYRLKNLVANDTRLFACKLIMSQYLKQYKMEEFHDLFEHRLEEMIYVRSKLLDSTHGTVIRMLRQREPPEKIQQYLEKHEKLHQLVHGWKVAFSTSVEK